MDNIAPIKDENPHERSNCFSKLIFTWFVGLCRKCIKQQLTVDDLYRHLGDDSSSGLCEGLEAMWNDELERGAKASLFRAILKTYFWYYFLYGIVQFIQFTFIYSTQPIILAKFINLFVDNEENFVSLMCIYGAVMTLMSFVISFINNHITLLLSRLGMKIRIACCSLVYKKTLRLSQKAINQSSAGQIVNLLSNDVSRFDLVSFYINHIWIMPFQVIIVTYFISEQVGISAIIGVGSFIILTIPVNALFGKLTSILRLKVAGKTDARVKKMSEIISGIQIIKMYVWEKPFAKVVEIARSAEIDVLLWASYIRGAILSSSVFMQRTILFITVISYVLLGNTITPDKVFSILQFFTILQLSLAIFFPLAITYGAETLVTIDRLQDFLLLEEKSEPAWTKDSSKGIDLTNIHAAWKPEESLLKNITTQIAPGSLCVIIGPVGAGKSSLLQLLLGELKQNQGLLKIGGTTSYASQEPWLFTSTVSKNILFGQKLDRLRYEKVVRVCALEKDFELLTRGDQTVVGERGVSLSGGQKARINLARAVYRSADIYLLDDPLSAVDTHVGQHLFEECIRGYLKDKTRILVTHQLQYLPKADHIILLEDGEIKAQGTFEQVSKFDLAFTKNMGASEEVQEDLEDNSDNQNLDESSKTATVASQTNMVEAAEKNEETFDSGRSLSSAYWEYAKAGGNYWVLITLLCFLIFAQVISIFADLWVAHWTGQEVERLSCMDHNLELIEKVLHWNDTSLQTLEENCSSLIDTNDAMYIYTGLVLFSIAFMLFRAMYFYKVVMNASRNLHNRMFSCLLSASMRFFNVNPSGRILNRFSRDMGMIDEILPRMMLEAVQIILIMFSIFILVCVANPYMIVVTILLGLLFNKFRQWYMTVARNLKHLEGITKSPVFSHLTASINGITTIRSVGAESILAQEFDAHQDTHTGAWYLTLICTSAFGLWIDFISASYIACVIFSFIILSLFEEIDGSRVGLAISQAFMLTGAVQYGMFQTAQVVSHMTSVERILEYTKLEQEEPALPEPKSTETPLTWPSNGKITFHGVSLSYSKSSKHVLSDISFEIEEGQKIGVVGRTGAGKSSLINALFRLAPIKGKIVIDQVDTQTIPLSLLRKQISIIPQEPVLFSATLRYNLDPFDEFSDQQLWNALQEVELKDGLCSLEFSVQESGSNFSVGQRQLLCLARAILRNNKILVLDEATANVDPGTDELIQNTIRTKFRTCTVITIAHRLHTIMDSDKVLVMDEGRLMDFDHPYTLLQNEDGLFSKLVAQTGQSTCENLYKIAESNFNKLD